jgi:hypothetical protein
MDVQLEVCQATLQRYHHCLGAVSDVEADILIVPLRVRAFGLRTL